MSDYRPRNQDFLDLDSRRDGVATRIAAIFGAVGFVMMLLVSAYLTDAYNPASTGFSAAIAKPPPRDTAVAREPAIAPSVSELIVSRSGS
jgi:hypothetical protein